MTRKGFRKLTNKEILINSGCKVYNNKKAEVLTEKEAEDALSYIWRKTRTMYI